MYTYVFMTSIRVIPVSAVLSRVPYECLYLQKWVTPPLSLAAPLLLRGFLVLRVGEGIGVEGDIFFLLLAPVGVLTQRGTHKPLLNLT